MPIELQVAVATPLHKIFTYTHTKPLAPGIRVLVPFGSSPKVLGVVVDHEVATPTGKSQEGRPYTVKPITEVLDQEPVYSPNLLKLSNWLANYYMHPLGEVLRTMLPASSTKGKKITYEITDAGSRAPENEEHRPGALFARRKTITQATLRKKLSERSLSVTQIDDVVKTWVKKKWIQVYKETSIRTRKTEAHPNLSESSESNFKGDLFHILNQQQELAVSKIISEGLECKTLEERKPFLLFGVTGSGKTEVFLNVIRETLRNPKYSENSKSQTLVLVPEISLTPQMTRIFEDRFPGLVAVVHSAMDDRERWIELDRVRRGEARVLIGPRSAVFGPFANLKLIIVDEEHDSSYKQGSGLLYNARDVAIVRAGLEEATVILGSATPCMESWNNALVGKYKLIEMPQRASAKPLPSVETIDAKPAFKAISFLKGQSAEGENSAFCDEIITALQENLLRRQQSIVLVNRRGYAYYLMSLEDRKAFGCPRCSISLVVHGKLKTLRCHYCDYSTSIQKVITEQPNKTWAVIGYGSHKAEEQLKEFLPTARIARLDSDTVQDPHVLPEVLEKFRHGELDLLVGTQILAKGHDFPNVTLIVLLEVDQLLGLPDFRGGERTFQLLVQAAGRSGRGELAGKVIVQSLRAKHPVVQSALKQDFKTFAASELEFRRALGYPPFARLILFEFNGSDPRRLDQWCGELERSLFQLFDSRRDLAQSVKVLGPSPAPIEIIRGRYRRTIMLLSESMQNCRAVAWYLMQQAAKPPKDIRVKIDVDPQSTL
jgi:primosomal protein N' (replication factor Y) (superfamily II helicase)